MTNYICINGQKAELTEEQLKALGIELPKVNPFAKQIDNEVDAYFINSMGSVQKVWDTYNMLYKVGNYCTDKAIMEKRALHETINRLLWRYSMEHDGDKIEWNSNPYINRTKAFIYYNHIEKKFEINNRWDCQFLGCVWFNNNEIAENAIKEIIEPFMKAHPDFKW